MADKQVVIRYKTKVREMVGGRKYIDYKKSVTRKDCLLKPHEHAYYNSDMFPSILTKAALKAQGSRTWSYIDELPAGITIDTTTGFLAVVTITC